MKKLIDWLETSKTGKILGYIIWGLAWGYMFTALFAKL